MKKILPLLILVPYLFIAGTTAPNRFDSAEDMCRGLMRTFQENDSLRYLDICTSRDEATAAFVTPFASDNNLYVKQQKAIDGFYANNNSVSREAFRRNRNKVVQAHLDWQAVQFISSSVTQLKDQPPGINYLFDVKSKWKIGDREIDVEIRDAMETSKGWNAGTKISVQMGLDAQQSALRDRLLADSAMMADSMMMAEMYMIQMMKADSAHMADSMAKARLHKHHN